MQWAMESFLASKKAKKELRVLGVREEIMQLNKELETRLCHIGITIGNQHLACHTHPLPAL